jgi:hypothetical protein
MIKTITKIISHMMIILYCSFFITLFACGIFGDFISNDGHAIQEYLVISALFFIIYIPLFIRGKK